jgi:hypothetical protein
MSAADVIGRLDAAGVRLTLLPPNHIAATPKSALTDDLRELIRQHKRDLLAKLQALRTCDRCQHSGAFFTRAAEYGENYLHVTCRAPVEAGLTRVFEIVYLKPGFAKRCVAFTPKATH